MKNKKIKKLADESLAKLIDEDFKKVLLSKQESKQEPKKDAKFWAFGVIKKAQGYLTFALSTALIASALLCFFLIDSVGSKNKNEDDYYTGADFIKSVRSSIEELNFLLYGLNVLEDKVTWVNACSDIQTEDLLFIRVAWQDEETIQLGSIDFVINPNYNHPDRITPLEFMHQGYKVEHSSKSKYMGEGVYAHTTYAKMEVGNARIYFNEYEELSYSAESRFPSFISRVFEITI